MGRNWRPECLMRILGVTASGFDTGSYELITTTILGSATPSVTFDISSFASTYKHLQIRMVARESGTGGSPSLNMRFNGNSSSIYASHFLFGTGSSVASSGLASQDRMFLATISDSTKTSGIFTPIVTDILDFSSSTKNTTVRTLYGNVVTGTGLYVGFYSALFNNTAAITSVELSSSVGNLVAGSRFSLYGIKG
jgi:hypothetical protein